MKKTIESYHIEGKKVIIRCDFNVPMKDGVITDDNRIVQSLETIEYALKYGAKVILMSHLGRVKVEDDKKKNTLYPVAKRLSELLHQEVIFVAVTHGNELEDAVASLKSGQVLLMENTRYEDIDGKKESGNDEQLGMYWASLGDIYINDAFGTSHRSHASNVGIASHIPNGVGFLIDKELKIMKQAIDEPVHPFTVILGGAKVSDKIGVIENLVHIADYILIGGGMAFTFLKAKGYEIGASLLDESSIDFCKEMLKKYSDKIILPVDVVCCKNEITNEIMHKTLVSEMEKDDIGLDIGTSSIDLFEEYLNKSKTIIWNGPVGMFELSNFALGTEALCDIIVTSGAKTIIGGGDTAAAVIQMGYQDRVDHISTGGGASLELLEGKILPGVDMIEEA